MKINKNIPFYQQAQEDQIHELGDEYNRITKEVSVNKCLNKNDHIMYSR